MSTLGVNLVVMEHNMPGSRPSKRFSPSTFTEKVVPVFLVILILALFAVIVIIVLALFGIFPSA